MIRILKEQIEKERIKIRIYILGRLHSKAHIFDYPDGRHDKGNAIIGSSNLSLGSLSDNTELNALVPGNSNHEKLTEWFDRLWSQSEEFAEDLINEQSKSWALNEVRPYDAPKIICSMAMLKTYRDAEIAPRIIPELSGT